MVTRSPFIDADHLLGAPRPGPCKDVGTLIAAGQSTLRGCRADQLTRRRELSGLGQYLADRGFDLGAVFAWPTALGYTIVARFPSEHSSVIGPISSWVGPYSPACPLQRVLPAVLEAAVPAQLVGLVAALQESVAKAEASRGDAPRTGGPGRLRQDGSRAQSIGRTGEFTPRRVGSSSRSPATPWSVESVQTTES